jgi:hypothetical protein
MINVHINFFLGNRILLSGWRSLAHRGERAGVRGS